MFSATTKDDLNNLKNSSQDAAFGIKDDLQNTAHQAGCKVRSAINSTSDDISAEIRTNPVRSAAIALGVGVLLGALLRR